MKKRNSTRTQRRGIIAGAISDESIDLSFCWKILVVERRRIGEDAKLRRRNDATAWIKDLNAIE